MNNRSPFASFALFAAIAAGLSAVVFLLAGGLLSSWDGVVTSAVQSIDGNRAQVWVYEGQGKVTRKSWPSAAVRGLNLRVDPTGTVPAPLPDGLAVTKKSIGTLSFIVTDAEDKAQVHSTLSTGALSVAVLVFFLLLLVRNMVISGSPTRIEPRPLELPKAQGPSGQVAPSRAPRPKKGPPPPNKRRR